MLIDNTKQTKIPEEDMKYNSYKGIKITKRNDNRWQARYTLGGKRTYVYGKTKKECYENLKNSTKSNTIKTEKNISFYEYWNQWITNYKIPFYKKSTINNYNTIFKNQIMPNFKDRQLKQITSLDVNIFLNNMKNTRMKEFTCQYMKEILKQAYYDGKIKSDIYKKIIKYHHKRKEGHALTEQQRHILIQKAKNTKYDIFIFYLFTGCRPTEGLNIQKSDFEDNSLHIKGTKTQKSDRWVPILTPVKEIYEKYKSSTNKTLFDISDTTLKRRRLEFIKICGFHFNTKDLRTTFATMCAEKGVSPKVIAKWLGHTTTNTTNKYYIKVLTEYEKEQIKLIDTNFDTKKED